MSQYIPGVDSPDNLRTAQQAIDEYQKVIDANPSRDQKVNSAKGIAYLYLNEKKWDDARAAWQVYLDWAAKYPEAKAYTGSGTSRQAAIDAAKKQDQAYAVVRQRIADTKNGSVFTDLSKQPPAPATPPAGGATK